MSSSPNILGSSMYMHHQTGITAGLYPLPLQHLNLDDRRDMGSDQQGAPKMGEISIHSGVVISSPFSLADTLRQGPERRFLSFDRFGERSAASKYLDGGPRLL